MENENNGFSLEGKMDDWGPFGKKEGKWLIFSIGNPEEGHGYALPRNIDDLHAQHVAILISRRTGGRYVAHIPWSTDNVGPIAKDWSPKTIPVKEIVEKIIPFLRNHLKNYQEMGLPANKVFIYSGHGGNNPIVYHTKKIRSELNLEQLIISTSEGFADEIADKALRELEKLSIKLASERNEDPKKIRRKLIKILTSIDHAGHFEHSLGAAIGVLDKKKLKKMNIELEKDFYAAIKKWPPLGGLGGFLLYGGKYEKFLGTKENDIEGHWHCLNTLRRLNGGKVLVIKELGELIVNLIVEYYSKKMLDS
jgi:creatinine amidohydrolase/Fe(II)-dependent formamide hydrolase-like protein